MHKFEEKKIRASCIQDYPKATKDLEAPQEVKGILNLICDHLLDLDLLKGSETAEDSEQHDADSSNSRTSDIESTPFTPDIELQTVNNCPILNNSQEIQDKKETASGVAICECSQVLDSRALKLIIPIGWSKTDCGYIKSQGSM